MDLKENKRPLRFALLMAAFSALGPFSFDMYLPSFPQMMKFFGTDAFMIQASLTACLLGLSMGQIVTGAFSDVYGRRKPLMIAMILYSLSSFGCAFAPNITVFIVLRFIQGFAISAGTISSAIVRDLYSGVQLTKFFSLIAMIRSLAPLLAPIAGGIVISYTTWTGVFIFLGFLGIFLTAITTWKLKETLPVERRVPGNVMESLRNFRSLLQNRTFMGYALVQGIMAGGIFAYVSGTSFIYQKIYGVSPQMFSMLFALNGISLILGSQMVRGLAGRVTERRILLTGLSLAFFSSTTVLVVILTHGPLIALVIPLFFFVASNGITGPASFSLAMESQGHIAGSASAMLGVIPFLLGSVTSPLVGIAGEYSAVPLRVIILTTSSLSIIAYVSLVKKTKRSTQRSYT
ncbi:multidrug effflux MFS transporter [Paenibacillus filicis]|uniref:Bcr/CflA family efflux transporter n=1 Tax=Paenibacillus gyeongsangnamensis TaxID=3388067 RepID=A0ABT4QLV2_9BACL|nr:multidrug effflux MFS transporter [Paenibacillus filicis]MCZ8517671.1 multidrug effflux MFS transporter [Paenibacillus filicis]